MQDFRNLRVWHAAHRLACDVVEALPRHACNKVPGLRSQAITAATSVPANLAEGCGRATRSEFLSFIDVAVSSLNEAEGHLLLARDVGILDPSHHEGLAGLRT